MTAPSAPDINEGPLVRWLFAEPPNCRLLLPLLGNAPDTIPVFQVRDPVLDPDSFPGDIDVLVCGHRSPDRAIAIECKRVRVDSVDFHTGQPGKLQDLRKGVAQANGLRALGFHRAILLVIVVSDGRDRTAFNFVGRGLTPQLVRTVNDFPGRDDLDRAVGLAFVEVSQPVNKEVSLAAGVGVRVIRAAVEQVQPPSLTDKVRRLLDQIAAHQHEG